MTEIEKLPTIYIASKTKHADKWIKLRAQGANIISTWIDEAGEGQTKDMNDLCLRCRKESLECDAMIVYSEEGDYLKGAFIEMGIALSVPLKPIYLVGNVLPYGNAFTYSHQVFAAASVERAIELIKTQHHFSKAASSNTVAPVDNIRWVSADVKPEYNVGVLVFIPDEDFHITSGMWDISNKWVLLDEYRVPDCEVTHWMPIPAIPDEYKKEQQENNAVMDFLSKHKDLLTKDLFKKDTHLKEQTNPVDNTSVIVESEAVNEKINSIALCFMENINVNQGTSWSQMLRLVDEIKNALLEQTKEVSTNPLK